MFGAVCTNRWNRELFEKARAVDALVQEGWPKALCVLGNTPIRRCPRVTSLAPLLRIAFSCRHFSAPSRGSHTLSRRLPRRASRARVLEPRMTLADRRPRGLPDPPARRRDLGRAPGADARGRARARSSSCSGRAARGRRRCCARSPAFDTLSAGVARVLGVDVGALGPGAAARFRAREPRPCSTSTTRGRSPPT